MKQVRTAILYAKTNWRDSNPLPKGYTAVPAGNRVVAVRAVYTKLSLLDALDAAKPRKGETVLNTIYIAPDEMADPDEE